MVRLGGVMAAGDRIAGAGLAAAAGARPGWVWACCCGRLLGSCAAACWSCLAAAGGAAAPAGLRIEGAVRAAEGTPKRGPRGADSRRLRASAALLAAAAAVPKVLPLLMRRRAAFQALNPWAVPDTSRARTTSSLLAAPDAAARPGGVRTLLLDVGGTSDVLARRLLAARDADVGLR
jgi:hypothetical protein